MLCNDQCMRIGLLDCIPEFCPEPVVILRGMSKICCNVQSPSICMKGRRYPFSRDLQNIVLKLSGSLIIQLGKCIVAPPSIIGRIIGEPVIVMETEVIMIWTVF